jgi:Na+-driven multidrug efflux pump
MVGLVCGSILNILLDPLLIYTFHLGIAGASLATLISQVVSVLILLSAYTFKKSQIALFQKIRLQEFSETGAVLLTGLPSAFRQGLTVLATVLLNRAAGAWGDAAVAAISVVTRLFLLAFSICLGVGQGMMPVVGYNYGFGNRNRVRRAFLFSVLLSTATMLAISIPFWIWASPLIAFFRNDREVITIGAYALRLQCYVFPCHGLITCTIMLLQAIGRRFSSSLLASARQGLFFVPLIFLLPSLMGGKGILFVQPIADVLTFFLAIGLAVYQWRQLPRSPKSETKKE